MGFLKTYSASDKRKYYDSKARELSDRYKIDRKTCIAKGDLIVTDNWDKQRKIKRVLNSEQYDKDMYMIAYYVARSSGDDHKKASKFARDNFKDMKYKKVVHIDDVNNILKNYIDLEE